MDFVEIPNLPESLITLAIVDGRIKYEAEKKFLELGIDLIKTEKYANVYDSISFHPDIQLHHVANNRIVYAPGTAKTTLDKLSSYGFNLIKGSTSLEPFYPKNISYNIARVGNLAFHNLKYTDEVLRKEVEKEGVEFVHVNQGYAKCSVSIVDHKSIITQDAGIAKAAEKKGLEVLLIKPDENILLPGIKYGFIGGSSGLIDKNRWMIFGELRNLSAYQTIMNFLEKRNIACVEISNQPIYDIGSIIPLLTA